VILIFLAIALVNHIRHPALLKKCIEYLGAEQGMRKEAAARDLNAELYGVIHERKPDLLPADMREALEARDASALAAIVSSRRMNIVLTLDSKESNFNEETGLLILGSDVVTGFGSIATAVPIFIGYFTILTWAMRGKTAGKAMVRIRVTRLDGRRLSLWDSFGRAGGYAASAGTAFLGFLEAFWHPNRQTIHDRIAGTIVIRETRRR